MTDVERRVRRLERTNLGLMLALGVVFACGAVQATKVPTEIRAERFVVVDAGGTERITMGTLDDMSDIQFWRTKDRAGLTLGIDRGSSYVSMLMGENMPGAILTTEKAGALLSIAGRKESVRFGFNDRETFGAIADRDGNRLFDAQRDRPVR